MLFCNCALHRVLYLTCTSLSRAQFNWAVDRESTEAKLAQLMNSVEEFEDEMQHRFHVSKIKNPFIKYTWDKMAFLQDFSFLLAIIINLLILVAYGLKEATTALGDNPRC